MLPTVRVAYPPGAARTVPLFTHRVTRPATAWAAWHDGHPPPSRYRGCVVDYIGRALVADALRIWRRDLEGEGTSSLLRDLSGSSGRVLNLAGAHPSGLAQLFAERPTLVSSLFRESDDRAGALAVVRVALEQAEAARVTSGVATGGLVVGTLSWADGTAGRLVPLLIRPVTFEASRDDDVQIILHHSVSLNPVVAAELRDKVPDRSFDDIVEATLKGPEFDPRPLWMEIRGLTDAFGDDVEVDEVLLLGSFDDPEQRLLDDLDECSHLISSSAVLAAVAGDRTVREELEEALPAPTPGDRDPFAERGLGDLDDVQFAALDVIATGRSVFIQVPPGGDAVGTAVAVAADGAASGKVVAVVAGETRSIAAVVQELDRAGVGELYINGADARWNTTARTRVLEAMTSSSPPIDEAELREVGGKLVAARTELRERFEELHRRRSPWEVSAYRAVQEIVRLTSAANPPSTPVRIGSSAISYIVERGIEMVAAAAAKEYEARVAAETQGVLFAEGAGPDSREGTTDGDAGTGEDRTSDPVPESPSSDAEQAEPKRQWWEGVILDLEKGAEVDQALAAFLLKHLPRLRESSERAADDVGVDPAPSFRAWLDQVALFDDVRSTLDILSPAAFTGALSDLIAATAPEGSDAAAQLSRREVKSLRRQARELLRPGRPVEALHGALVEAHGRAVRWRAQCGAGGWPRVPDDLDAYAKANDEAWTLWARLAPVVEAVVGKGRLAERPWGEFQAVLESLTETRRLPLEESEVRDTREHLVGLGLEVLFDELASRSVSPSDAVAEIEFAWWASAFEAILTQAPTLTQYGAIGQAAERFLECDRQFGEMRVHPLMRAAGERRRLTIAQRQDDARDLFATLVEGGDGPFRDLWARFPELVGALRPVVLCSTDQASDLIPPERVIDTVVLLGIESASFAELVPALSRSTQVVALGDAHTATRGAIPALTEVLPSLVLHARPEPRDPRVTAVLSEFGYGPELEALPAAQGGGTFEFVAVDGIAAPAPGTVGVETTPAEVATVCVKVAERAGDSRAVIAANDAHAVRIREALEDWDGGQHRDVPVFTLGRAAGVEADVVVLSLGYGPDTRGEYPERLGVLSTALGGAALRQAIVAGRRDLVVVTSLPQKYLGWATGQGSPGHGIDAFADLVAMSETGPLPLRGAEGSWLFTDLARRLRDALEVRQRYGAGGDTIPLVVGRRGEEPWVAIVTDEEPPTTKTSLRDQVRWQRARLEALGWTVVPLFTLDVFMDPEAAADQVRAVFGLETRTPEPEPEAPSESLSAPEPSLDPGGLVPDRSKDDTDVGWGDSEPGGRDDDIKGDRPPHW